MYEQQKQEGFGAVTMNNDQTMRKGLTRGTGGMAGDRNDSV